MENELRKEGARPPAYRERQQVVGKAHPGFIQGRELCCVVCLKESTSCKGQKTSGQVRMPCGQCRAKGESGNKPDLQLALLP